MKYLTVIALFLAAGGTAFSQDDPIRVETNLVTLNVAVSRQGNAVKGLTRGDFRILDNGQPQEIDTFATQETPISYGIVLDLHPTTDEQRTSVLAALRKFTAGIRPSDDFFVSVFNEKGTLTTDFVPSDDQVLRQIDDGPTSLFDAIFAASARMARARNQKRVLFILTDGADHNSQHSYKELKLRLRSINLPVYSITFGSGDRRRYGYSDIFGPEPRRMIETGQADELDRGVVRDISKTSGGASFEGSARNQAYLGALLEKVSDEIEGQYVLGFYPEKSDGRWHKLKISVKDEKQRKLKVSGRPGYQSPRG